MSSFLTDAEKAVLSAEMDDIADTWDRDIYVWREAEKIIISTDPNYNRFQASNQNLVGQNPVNQPLKYTIKARILHEKSQPYPTVIPYLRGGGDGAQIKLNDPQGRVRVKIHPEDFQLFELANTFEVDGFSYDVSTVVRPHGLFNNQYYTYFLIRST